MSRGSFNLILESLIIDRDNLPIPTADPLDVSISFLRVLSLIGPLLKMSAPSMFAFQSHSWESYHWSTSAKLESIIIDPMFQSHSWESYHWSTQSRAMEEWDETRFNLILESLIIDRPPAIHRTSNRLQSFNLILESLIIDRNHVNERVEMWDLVSISFLRVLSLIGHTD